MNWQEFTGDYIKEIYLLKPKGTDEVIDCYPNAGKMMAIDGSGRQFEPNEGHLVTVVIPGTGK